MQEFQIWEQERRKQEEKGYLRIPDAYFIEIGWPCDVSSGLGAQEQGGRHAAQEHNR